MRHVVAAALVYMAFIGHVGLRFGVIRDWTPNLMLLVVLLAAPPSMQIAWAAVAGLLFDGITGRPLGVTMLVATLVVTIVRHLHQPQAGHERTQTRISYGSVFFTVFAIEALSRLLAGSVVNGIDYGAEVVVSLKIATSSCLAVILVHLLTATMQGLWRAVVSVPGHRSVTELPSSRVLRR